MSRARPYLSILACLIACLAAVAARAQVSEGDWNDRQDSGDSQDHAWHSDDGSSDRHGSDSDHLSYSGLSDDQVINTLCGDGNSHSDGNWLSEGGGISIGGYSHEPEWVADHDLDSQSDSDSGSGSQFGNFGRFRTDLALQPVPELSTWIMTAAATLALAGACLAACHGSPEGHLLAADVPSSRPGRVGRHAPVGDRFPGPGFRPD